MRKAPRVIWTFEEVHELNSDIGINPMEQKKWRREHKEKMKSCNFDETPEENNIDEIMSLLWVDGSTVIVDNSMVEMFKEDLMERYPKVTEEQAIKEVTGYNEVFHN